MERLFFVVQVGDSLAEDGLEHYQRDNFENVGEGDLDLISSMIHTILARQRTDPDADEVMVITITSFRGSHKEGVK